MASAISRLRRGQAPGRIPARYGEGAVGGTARSRFPFTGARRPERDGRTRPLHVGPPVPDRPRTAPGGCGGCPVIGPQVRRTTLSVYRVDPATGRRVEVQRPRAVVGSWLDVPSLHAWPPCRCPRCREGAARPMRECTRCRFRSPAIAVPRVPVVAVPVETPSSAGGTRWLCEPCHRAMSKPLGGPSGARTAG